VSAFNASKNLETPERLARLLPLAMTVVGNKSADRTRRISHSLRGHLRSTLYIRLTTLGDCLFRITLASPGTEDGDATQTKELEFRRLRCRRSPPRHTGPRG